MTLMQNLFGVLNVNKASGPTSRDVVNRVQNLVRPEKVGHAGTLDPLASGVLVICVGQATRLIQYVQRMSKFYRATFLLGHRSETDDVEGAVHVDTDARRPTYAEIEQALPGFVGKILQRPPAHSAIKLGGKRAYNLARKGERLELAARPIVVHRFAVTRYEYPEVELDIECGSGTYVRSLGRDLAAALGTFAVMSALVRMAVGAFQVGEAISVEELSAGDIKQQLLSPLLAVADLPRVPLTEDEVDELRHGRSVAMRAAVTSAGRAAARTAIEWAGVDTAGELVAILYEKRPGELWPALNLT